MAYTPQDAVGLVAITKSNQFAIVDVEDSIRLNKFKWNAHPRSKSIQRVVKIGPRYKNYSLASEVMQTPGLLYDHINRNPFDNRKQNLRLCTTSQNMANRKRYSSSRCKYKGIYPRANHQWQAQIRYQNRLYNLGTFATAIEAARAYDKKAMELQGAFAQLNFNDYV